MVLLLAIKDHASDLHFEPFENEFKIQQIVFAIVESDAFQRRGVSR